MVPNGSAEGGSSGEACCEKGGVTLLRVSPRAAPKRKAAKRGRGEVGEEEEISGEAALGGGGENERLARELSRAGT